MDGTAEEIDAALGKLPTGRDMIRRFIYLASLPFSGSTLFSFMLDAHPEIATVGEMVGLIDSERADDYPCSCGLTMSDCGFWREVSKAMVARGFSFDLDRFDTKIELGAGGLWSRLLSGSLGNNRLEDARDGLLRLWRRPAGRLRYIVLRNVALGEAILEVTGKQVFFDASKYHMAIRYLTAYAKVDLRVVHLVRDARGAVASYRKHNPSIGWGGAARDWNRGNANIERHLRQLAPEKHIRIRYEDLCVRPSETLDRVYSFCGVDKPQTATEWTKSKHHIIANRMRLDYAGEIKLDERWRKVLTAEDIRIVKRIAGARNARYGYPGM